MVVRGTRTFARADGKRVPTRLLPRYRLANGKIVENEPFSNPSTMEVLGSLLSR